MSDIASLAMLPAECLQYISFQLGLLSAADVRALKLSCRAINARLTGSSYVQALHYALMGFEWTVTHAYWKAARIAVARLPAMNDMYDGDVVGLLARVLAYPAAPLVADPEMAAEWRAVFDTLWAHPALAPDSVQLTRDEAGDLADVADNLRRPLHDLAALYDHPEALAVISSRPYVDYRAIATIMDYAAWRGLDEVIRVAAECAAANHNLGIGDAQDIFIAALSAAIRSNRAASASLILSYVPDDVPLIGPLEEAAFEGRLEVAAVIVDYYISEMCWVGGVQPRHFHDYLAEAVTALCVAAEEDNYGMVEILLRIPGVDRLEALKAAYIASGGAVTDVITLLLDTIAGLEAGQLPSSPPPSPQ
ncbi:uncharacterized protein AMSG_01715 [Thecamonas trahens ATCC 50062]|uniref:Uncharacterized protein n=1 Tax=Thecamonas trahens ATCC 50062 TaxID=461836 RepID=A0A0L0DS44_THETB|nr:hypothetical protein AMSG_01715 [Thecamonas trahens ATCC 50062]KNC54861.1 hypothetical protein AMSG_01715 [Thecamonas trahens ATCC 50062]|eukprot:XP_013761758.1 hypothetical protein AMSG_01715 [Thecamonas trahens ATCC 50062]